MPGFKVIVDDVGYDINITIRYLNKTTADEVLTALSQCYAKAFAEVDSRLGVTP